MKILLVGTGGYAVNYVQILLDQRPASVVWEGIVDPFYAMCPLKDQIDAHCIPVYDTMEQFYACHTADLAIICTPTFLHCAQSVCALSHGSNVLCEKPAAPTVDDAQKMMEAEKQYGRFIAIGYQWSYSEAMRKLKEDVLGGLLGEPKMLKTFISWPRSRAYYQRGGGWGGKIRRDGRLVLDSIASNACAHYLHNMLFLLGDDMQTSVDFETVRAECYRANDIENFDTCCIKLTTRKGGELYFAASHAVNTTRNPEFEYAFEKGTVRYALDEGSDIVAQFHDGSSKNYGNPFEASFQKLWDCIDAVQHGTVPVCTVKTATPHVRLIEEIYRSIPIENFPQESIFLNEETDGVFVDGLYERLHAAYKAGGMLSEISPV